MEKALDENQKAMFGVALGDSHQHAYLKGIRKGLDDALAHYRADVRDEDADL